MGFCCHVWCVRCHSMAHFRLSRLVVHKGSCFTPSRHQRFFQNYAGLSVTLKPTTPSSRKLASLSLSSAAFRVQSLPALSLFSKTSLTLSCLPFKRWFGHGSTPPRSQYHIEQDKEKAVLNKYERTYSPNKKYTKRTLKEDEIKDENEIFDHMKPEDTFGTLSNQYKKKVRVKLKRGHNICVWRFGIQYLHFKKYHKIHLLRFWENYKQIDVLFFFFMKLPDSIFFLNLT